jgi:hypothetical protein
VLIGPRTASSALLNAIQLRRSTAAILVGQPTGHKPNAYGEIKTFELPNCGLPVSYSTKLFQTVEGDPPALMPDIHVAVSSVDYFAGHDPVLEAVLAYPDPLASSAPTGTSRAARAGGSPDPTETGD